jgi:putative Holliday junction resolvase
MRVVGIDYGRKRIGLARSDEDEVLASPLPTYIRGGDVAGDLDRLSHLVLEQGATKLVIGWPLHMSGAEGEMAVEARAFAAELQARTGLPVELFDERWTSAQAEEAMISGDVSRHRRRELRDGLAAMIILQGFLDRERAT